MEKPPLLGEKFQRAVICRGTLLKQLQEAKLQFERHPKLRPLQAHSVSVQYSSPLHRVNQPQQQTQAQTYQTQPFQRDPTKKSSGRGRARGWWTAQQRAGGGVLSVVRDGYQVEWLKKPFQVVEPLQTFSKKEKSFLIDQEVRDIVWNGAIEKVSNCPGQVSLWAIFSGGKERGSMPVINLKSLNHLVKYRAFPDGGFRNSPEFSDVGGGGGGGGGGGCPDKAEPQGCFFLDISASWGSQVCQVPVAGESFLVQGSPVQVVVSTEGVHSGVEGAYGVSQAPGFQKCDSFGRFCLANQEKLSRPRTLAKAWLLEKLGFMINWRKSLPHPSQREEFLGFVVDTVNLLVILPQEKVCRISQLCQELLEKRGGCVCWGHSHCW